MQTKPTPERRSPASGGNTPLAAAIATFALAATVVVPGMVPLAPSAEPASVQTARTTLSGDVSLELTGTAWVDLAWKIRPGMTAEDVDLNVTYVWERTERHDRTQRWLCSNYGLRFDGEPKDDYSIWCTWVDEGDSVYGVQAHAMGSKAEVEVLNPGCHLVDCGEYWYKAIQHSTEEHGRGLNYTDLLNGEDEAVVHLTAAAGGPPPDRVAIEGTVRDTEVGIRTGPYADTFTVWREDFDSGLYVSTELAPFLPDDPYYQEDASYRTFLDDHDRHTAFWYWPLHVDQWGEETLGWVRPDGTEATDRFSGTEVTTLDGRWRFWFTRATNAETPQFPPDLPILLGTHFARADAP